MVPYRRSYRGIRCGGCVHFYVVTWLGLMAHVLGGLHGHAIALNTHVASSRQGRVMVPALPNVVCGHKADRQRCKAFNLQHPSCKHKGTPEPCTSVVQRFDCDLTPSTAFLNHQPAADVHSNVALTIGL